MNQKIMKNGWRMNFVVLMGNWNGLLIKALKTLKGCQINKNLKKTERIKNSSLFVPNGLAKLRSDSHRGCSLGFDVMIY